MSRITQRPRQIDLNRPIIKYDNFEEFSKLDTTYEVVNEPIIPEKTIINYEINASSSANKKKDNIMKEKKGKADINSILQKQDILIPEIKKIEETKQN